MLRVDPEPFASPFDRLTVLSHSTFAHGPECIDGQRRRTHGPERFDKLTAPSIIEGESRRAGLQCRRRVKEGIGQEKAKTFSPDILAFKRTLNIEEEELFRPTSLPWEA